MNIAVNSFLHAFILTNLLESIPYSLIIRRPLGLKLSALVLINTLTLPLLWLILPFFYDNYVIALLMMEAVIVLTEAYLTKILLKQPLKTALKASITSNILSGMFTLA
ncbi:MAG: hypothetical protein ABIH11_07280 [Candidatus Altiarchaeota archaeon]